MVNLESYPSRIECHTFVKRGCFNDPIVEEKDSKDRNPI